MECLHSEEDIMYGSVCSGIEAATVAWHELGWTPSWFAEIEKYTSEVLAYHYPNVRNLGDMTKIEEMVRAGLVSAPDILVGGTPCQAYSVAGLRNGLNDARGQLTISYVKLADAIDTVRTFRGQESAIIVWENVPGVLSDKTNAFGCFLAGLAGEDCELEPPRDSKGRRKSWPNAGCVYGPKRTIAWRVIDAQYTGVAQRRRRVFVVASARDNFDPTEVLFEFEGLRRDIAPSRETRQELAGKIGSSSTSSSHWDGEFAHPTLNQANNCGGVGMSNQELFSQRGAYLVPDVAKTLLGKPNDSMAEDLDTYVVTANRMVAFGEYVTDGTASTMKARGYKDATDLVAYGIPGNWIGRKPENGGNAVEPMRNISPCLTSTDRHGVAAYSVSLRGRDGSATAELGGEVSGCLRASTGGGDKAHVLAPIAFSCKDNGRDASFNIAPTLRSGNHNKSHANGGQPPAIAFDARQECISSVEVFGALSSPSPQAQAVCFAENSSGEIRLQGGDGQIVGPLTLGGGKPGQGYSAITYAMAVRRLTPRECERLQGFPDDYTLIPTARGSSVKPHEMDDWIAYLRSEYPQITRMEAKQMAPDGPRYKALGNSMAVTCMLFIGRRIKKALSASRNETHTLEVAA